MAESNETLEKEPQNKDEQVGFHKGSLTTLAKEREELLRIITIVEQLMQMHINALKELGIDLEKEAKAASPNPKKEKAPLESKL